MDGFPSLLPLRPVSNCALVVAPHADDEVLGCGGALALHRARGDRTRVLVLTVEEGSVRLEESRQAGLCLGVEEVSGLGLKDGELGRTTTWSSFCARLSRPAVRIFFTCPRPPKRTRIIAPRLWPVRRP